MSFSQVTQGHWVINGSAWEGCGDEMATQDSDMGGEDLKVLFYEFGVQGGVTYWRDVLRLGCWWIP